MAVFQTKISHPYESFPPYSPVHALLSLEHVQTTLAGTDVWNVSRSHDSVLKALQNLSPVVP